MAEAHEMTPAAGQGAIALAEVERFLVEEAALLDEWRLEEWLELVAEDGRYLVPSLDSPDSDHRTALFLIADDRRNLASRVRQLLGKTAWSENPRSRTRRLVTNVRILGSDGDAVKATANFAVWRFQHGDTDVYVGRYIHLLVRGPQGLLFRERRTVMDMEALRPHGKLSFIL
ncbi:MAG: aromatic-ring-hydroxylating dioxygenase subunit beta [Sneathiellaceae bacterium]